MKIIRNPLIVTSLLLLLGIAACSRNTIPTLTIPTEGGEALETNFPAVTTATETTVPTPTSTPVPAAATVNGEIIPLADFEEEYLRFLDGQVSETNLVDEATGRAIVLEDMIVNTLLAQAARNDGFTLTEEYYQERLNEVIELAGGETVFNTWLSDNHYQAESFRRLYALSLEAAWMKEKIINQVPVEAEQIRARQIIVQTSTLAEMLYAQLEAGADFATLAWAYDPISGGELGWFPRNTLVLPDIEQAVFGLEPNQYTPILETDYGYQIIQVMERGVRPLSQEAILIYQSRALEDWVTTSKNQSDLEIYQ